jgi:hypothetical protein
MQFVGFNMPKELFQKLTSQAAHLGMARTGRPLTLSAYLREIVAKATQEVTV